MSIEPVVGDESDPYAIREEDLPQIFDEYDKLARYIIEKDKKGEGFNFFTDCIRIRFIPDKMCIRDRSYPGSPSSYKC